MRRKSPLQSKIVNRQSKMAGGSNSVVESQPSKLLVAGSIPVSRSRLSLWAGQLDPAKYKERDGGNV